jgi:ADP-heptose:LPS heptosyltransferase
LLKSGIYSRVSGARTRLGFHKKNCREPLASLFYTSKPAPFPENMHVIDKNLRLLTLLGIEEKSYDFSLKIPASQTDSIRHILSELGYNKEQKLVLFNVGAAWETKRWFTESWIRLIRSLDRQDIFPLLLWGTEDERRQAEDIRSETQALAAPFLDLSLVMALIQEAHCLVSGDTFALQAACALARPVVALFGPTNPARNGPFSPLDKTVFHKRECSFCYKRTCPDPACLKSITPEEVFSLVLGIIDKNG